jgi:hypothetical protein
MTTKKKRVPRNKAVKNLMVVQGTGIPGNNKRPARLNALGVERISALAATGLSEQGCAAIIGLDVDTFYKARDAQPEVAAAFAHGRAQLESHLAGNLVAQSDAGNVAATIFGLKNAGWSDGGRTGEAVVNNTQINIQLPKPMAQAAYMKMITAAAKDD